MKVSVVYYAFVNPFHRWQQLIAAQLLDLKICGLAPVADVHVALAATDSVLLDAASQLTRRVLPGAAIQSTTGNQFEYPGLSTVWNTARASPAPEQHVILYFHSKGMVNGDHTRARDVVNLKLTKYVIYPWRTIVDRFQTDPLVMKAGFAASQLGWMWFNFWWARASYLQRLVPPIATDRRHYFEDWLGRVDPNDQAQTSDDERGQFFGASDCLSLAPDNRGQELAVVYDVKHAVESLGRRATLD